MAAQQREAEREARAQAKLARDREKALQQMHVEAQQRAADLDTAEIARKIQALDEILARVLPLAPVTFDHLAVTPKFPAFTPGRLGTAEPAPRWDDYAPSEPGGLSRLFGGSARHERQVAESRTLFESAVAEHRQREGQRQQAFAAARAEHDRVIAAIRAKASAQNAELAKRRADFAVGDPEAVEWFVRHVLDASRYPGEFPRKYAVAYRPENRDVVVEFELPPQDAVPAVRGYRYVKARDSIDPLPRPATDIKQRYARLIACIALRTLYEIFSTTPGDVVEAVVFNGRVSTIDRSTGNLIGPICSASKPSGRSSKTWYWQRWNRRPA